ncbi:hypothetical protein, partial [Kingella kingae]
MGEIQNEQAMSANRLK